MSSLHQFAIVYPDREALGVAVQGLVDHAWPVFGFLQGADANWLLLSNLILLAGVLVVPLVYLPRGKVFSQTLHR